MSRTSAFAAALSDMPAIAILRGITPSEAGAMGEALYRAGFRIIEVPLNSPQPVESIGILAGRLGKTCFIGAGTVLDPDDVDAVVDAGARLVVSPNTDVDVISRTLARDAVALPGMATATEALRACSAGARYLKLFPASSYGPAHVAALRAVLPGDIGIVGVGGIGADGIGAWLSAGLCGVGVGSEIYRAGDSEAAVFDKATAVTAAIRNAMK